MFKSLKSIDRSNRFQRISKLFLEVRLKESFQRKKTTKTVVANRFNRVSICPKISSHRESIRMHRSACSINDYKFFSRYSRSNLSTIDRLKGWGTGEKG